MLPKMLPEMADLGKRLKEVREVKGLTLDDAAKRTKIPVVLLEKYEQGKTFPTFEHLHILTRLYETDIGYLLVGNGPFPVPVWVDKLPERTKIVMAKIEPSVLNRILYLHDDLANYISSQPPLNKLRGLPWRG